MNMKTKAILLHSLKYGDHQLVSDFFTEEQGRQSYISRLSKSGRGQIKKPFFQPLTLLDLEYDYRPNSRLQHIRNIRMSRPYTSIPFDPDKLSLALFISDFLYYAIRNEQRNVALFDFIEKSMEWLDDKPDSFANFHLVFMLHLTRFIGFYPNIESQVDHSFFDLREGQFVTFPPLYPDYLRPQEAQVLSRILQTDYSSMDNLTFSHDERNQATEMILHYYRLHVPDFPELKSFEILKQLYS
ncbi:MAG: DNA repair protein RecO [Prevotella sp.]|jgi:DNA repair protein RecO (recombination protein O)|nr:DNA repair protein RecO [Prevotella sp.]MCH3994354.1 DNA repair protein RecO [Prevotella sp.]